MKLANMTVSMPMNTYKQIETLLNEYEVLKQELQCCFNTDSFDVGNSNCIEFDVKKVVKICHNMLSIKYTEADVNFTI